MLPAFYNDNEPYVAQWLRNLIEADEIPPGDVDERDIREVQASDLEGYGQVHFFAGIGGWPLALELAGWGDRSVWTGSCPCQPLSSAGQRKGHADERHLWPAFYSLIKECKPPTIFGEQVASKDGREWLAGVRADLEHLGYAVGAADLPAASKKAKHNRPRLFFVAHGAELWSNGGEDYTGSDSIGWDTVPKSRNSHCTSAWQSRPKSLDKPPFPVLAHAIPNLVGAVSAYGNSICPPLAAEFIRAVMKVET